MGTNGNAHDNQASPNANQATWQAAVEDELRRILDSPAFRSSKRCQKLLAHTVTETLAGRIDDLKERTIGVAVFGRRPDYDTSEDSSVRVTAGEVRKRLAQYYVQNGVSSLRIDLPAGSYVPVLREVSDAEPVPDTNASPVAQGDTRRQRLRGVWIVLAAVLLIGAVMAYSLLRTGEPASSGLTAFWRPVIAQSSSVLVCLGGQLSFLPRPPLAKRILSRLPVENMENSALELRPEDKVNGSDLRGSIDEQVATGDAHAALLISNLLGKLNTRTEFRLAYTAGLNDVQRNAAVLVGAFNNRWSLALTSKLPISFAGDWGDRTLHIRDNSGSGTTWRFIPAGEGRRYPTEYALVSRVVHPASGRPFVAIGGFGHSGTLAAGQVITSEQLLAAIIRKLPGGWENRNVQIVLEVPVVNGMPGEIDVAAVRTW